MIGPLSQDVVTYVLAGYVAADILDETGLGDWLLDGVKTLLTVVLWMPAIHTVAFAARLTERGEESEPEDASSDA